MATFITTENNEDYLLSTKQYNLLNLDNAIRFSLCLNENLKRIRLRITSTDTSDIDSGITYSGREALQVWDKIKDAILADVLWDTVEWMMGAFEDAETLIVEAEKEAL